MRAGELFPSQQVDGFDLFWRAYPRRVGKADAERAWKKIAPNDDLLSRILAAIDWQVYTWEKPFTFTPYPATWLRGRRWEDEMPQYIHDWLQRMANSSHPVWSKNALDILVRNDIHPDVTIRAAQPSQNFLDVQKQVHDEWRSR